MAVTGFNELLQTMASADFFTGILPFLLTYLVSFLAIQRLPLIEDNDSVDSKKFSALISLIISFFVANFLVQNPAYQAFFSAYLGRIVIGMVGILGFLILVGLIGWDMDKIKEPFMGIILVFFAIAAFAISDGVYAFIPRSTIPFVGMTLQETVQFTFESGLIWLLVIGGALYWVTSEDNESRDWGDWMFPTWPARGGQTQPQPNPDEGN